MPLLRTLDTDLETIPLPTDGEWVKVKRKMGRDDERAVTRLLLAGKPATAETRITIDAAQLSDAVFCTMQVVLKEWSFAEAINADNIRALDDASVECIAGRIGELYESPRTEEATGNSSGDGARLSLVEEPSPKPSAGSQSWIA